MSALYTAQAHVTGGRNGHGETSDGLLKVDLAMPKELGGKVLFAPRPEVFDGKLAVITDPTGAAIGVMEWPERMTKGGK